MAGNTVYVQGSYVDVHDNEVVNLTIDKAGTVVVGDGQQGEAATEAAEAAEATDDRYNVITSLRDNETRGGNEAARGGREAELFHFIHPSLDDGQAWLVHEEVGRLVRRQGIQEICGYLRQLSDAKRILLPLSPSVAYAELVRMGMSSGDGFSEKTFQKHYRR